MLLVIDKIVLIKHAKNIVQWPVYLIIGNFSHKIRRLRSRPKEMMIGLILIYKNDSLEVKIEIYHQTMRRHIA